MAATMSHKSQECNIQISPFSATFHQPKRYNTPFEGVFEIYIIHQNQLTTTPYPFTLIYKTYPLLHPSRAC